MRIGLDVRYLSHGLFGGVRNFVHALATELPRIESSHEFFYYADEKGPLELSDLPANVRVRTLPWRHSLSSIVNDTSLGRHAERDRLDVFHAPANIAPRSRVPVVLTIHDSLNLFPMREHLRGFSRRPREVAMMLYLGRQTRQSLRHASHITTPSEYSKCDIARRSGALLERFTVVYSAASDMFRPMTPEELAPTTARHGIAGSYLLADGIKNPGVVLDAYRRLPDGERRALQLVLFSREPRPRPVVSAAIREFGSTHVRFIARPPQSELVHLMAGATALLFPSFYEGFGLPLVEAMRCGVPIVASTRACIPEIVGDAGLCADIDTPGAFAGQVRRLLADEPLRQTVARRSLERGRRFNWKTTAEQMLVVFERYGQKARRAS
ncbi:MAG: glycosyltransferase family 1 protein [Vicinamibacterales bacterium]